MQYYYINVTQFVLTLSIIGIQTDISKKTFKAVLHAFNTLSARNTLSQIYKGLFHTSRLPITLVALTLSREANQILPN